MTIADREIEVAIRERIEKALPDHGSFGEETGRERCEADAVWVINPIDDTRSFITGWPLFGMLLAPVWRGRALFGQIDMPMLKECWVGWSGRHFVQRRSSAAPHAGGAGRHRGRVREQEHGRYALTHTNWLVY